MSNWLIGLVLAAVAVLSWGKEAAPAAQDPVLEARMIKIASELRCLVCQNQTIADSSAGLAIDLRNQVRDMLQRGQTDREILDYMTARYGDFVLYRPPLKASTSVLWFGPAVLLLVGALTLVVVLRRRSKMPAELFDADDTPADESPANDVRQTPTPRNPF